VPDARRLFAAALAAGALLAAPESALADARLSGGGTADISQVAMTVAVTDSGAASGSFLCLMAGRSAFALAPFGLERVMAVQATPTSASVSGSLVTFSGPGRLILDGRQKLDVSVAVWVDVAAQKFQLTVVGVGTLPVESLLTGQLALRT
jgi:hypothetical protein